MAKKIVKSAKSSPKSAKSNGKAKAKVIVAKQKPGTGLEFTETSKITMLVKENPKRGKAAKRFQAYLTKKPKTVAAAIAAGLTRADIRWDAGQGFIKLS